MKADKKTIKTQYLLLILPSSKERFQTLKKLESKTTWELFDDMLDVYEEKRGRYPDVEAV